MCHFADSGARVCTADATMNACQLCPQSPTYWRLTDPGPVADPWSKESHSAIPAAELVDRWPGAIDGVKDGWTHVSKPGPCMLCLKPSHMRNPKKEFVHKTCQEQYDTGRRTFARPR